MDGKVGDQNCWKSIQVKGFNQRQDRKKTPLKYRSVRDVRFLNKHSNNIHQAAGFISTSSLACRDLTYLFISAYSIIHVTKHGCQPPCSDSETTKSCYTCQAQKHKMQIDLQDNFTVPYFYGMVVVKNIFHVVLLIMKNSVFCLEMNTFGTVPAWI